MSPVILLNASLEGEKATLRGNYALSVARAGGTPLVIPAFFDEDDQLDHIEAALDRVDGVLLTGGADYHARLWGETLHGQADLIDPRRQRFDLALAQAALERGLPVLGICAGAQVLAVAAGGAIVQHLGADGDGSVHSGGSRHRVRVEPGSMLAEIVGALSFEVNSYHHQAVDPARSGSGLVPVAVAEAPITRASAGGELSQEPFWPALEALESPDRPILAVQWHPERIPDEPAGLALFEWLVDEAEMAT